GAPTPLNATGASQYVWSPTGTLSNPLIANPIASPLVTTTYVVSGTSQCATGSASDSVTVIVPVVAPLNINAGTDQQVCVGSTYNLISVSSGGFGGNTYMWTEMSGTSDTIQNPNSLVATVLPTTPGTNTYQVMVMDHCGYMHMDTVVVDVLLDCDLSIPNVFTPNGDGRNDEFKITGNGIKTFSITVYNRWGKKEFESNDINTSWDGKKATDGTYFYIINAENINGKQFNNKGYIQLLSK
ncbi:MAG: T9SS type B sorting domain-containing protein, partial [Bacteroidia bacterium]